MKKILLIVLLLILMSACINIYFYINNPISNYINNFMSKDQNPVECFSNSHNDSCLKPYIENTNPDIENPKSNDDSIQNNDPNPESPNINDFDDDGSFEVLKETK